MKRFLGLAIGIFLVISFTSSAEAVIKIETAAVQNGLSYIQGNGAAKGGQIFWEGSAVATANKNNGGFSFFGILPNDCVGALSDQPGGANPINVQVLGCAPVSQGGGVLKTGQTTSYATGDDGDFQAGALVPSPRFTDNGDGTVTDNVTGLMWLKDASCLGVQTWANALAAANALADGNVTCGLMDGSVAGDWRLPNRNELATLIDLGTFNPALSAGLPFTNFGTSGYWSSTTAAGDLGSAWSVDFNGFGIVSVAHKTGNAFVTAVRGGL